ncbi:MAG TPA: putative toxin-antitoxin system toxin component, PIN family [Candidatus Nanoarchaeia archaeon]|nr:putative toxin-antitoxin system toxin component, PIN family [Candidatus Nanoarchaeia archaeon]
MRGKQSKIVLDTNVVISAAISSDGNPAKIFEMLIREEVENFTTSEIIDEIKEIKQKLVQT